MRNPRLVHDILKQQVAERPDKIALVYEKRRLTYAQIDEMANRIANALYAHGVCRGDRVLLYTLNSIEAAVSIFATLKANAVYTVIDYATTPERLRYIASNCGAIALITHDQQMPLVQQMLDEVDTLRFGIVIGTDRVDQLSQSQELFAFEALLTECAPVPPPELSVNRDLANLVYTSGSTGEPKGVMTTHASALFAVNISTDYLELTESDVITSALPLSYSHGLNQLLQTFRVGATLILEKSFFYPTLTLRRMEREGATGFAGVPTILAMLLRLKLDRYDLSHLRYFSSAGAVLPPTTIRKLRQRFPQACIYSIYGMAEASNAFGLEPAQIDARPTSVGKPMYGTEAWLVDEFGNRLGAEQEGILMVRGGHVRCGYWNNPQASARRLRPGIIPGELVCYTGDVFRMDAEGYFYFVGRNDEVIKSGGKKVVPREIENVLYSIEGVIETAAIGIPDPLLGQVIKAYVVFDKTAESVLTEDEILVYCHQNLEAYMVPRYLEITESLPKTSSGKIRKAALT